MSWKNRQVKIKVLLVNCANQVATMHYVTWFSIIFQAEQEEKLRVKDADEEKKMDELREQAKQELQDW